MWGMKPRRADPPPEGESPEERRKRGTIIQVPTIRLDDFIANDITVGGEDHHKVYLLKIDTQGYEPSIFSGLEESIKDASIDYIIFEFWPRGMDLMANTNNECSGHKVLDQLLASGYTLYALGLESHPKAPLTGTQLKAEARTRPFTVKTTTREYCSWFFELEKKYPSKATAEEEYKFGYWTDFLAVAPGMALPDSIT